MMAAKFFALAAISLLCATQGVNEAKHLGGKMEEAISRSEKVRQQSMAVMQQTMTSSSALALLQKNYKDSPQLRYLVSLAQGKQGSLRKHSLTGNGTGARDMINDMIYQAKLKYDQDVTSCFKSYFVRCSALAKARGGIAAVNREAAAARVHRLHAVNERSQCDVDIPINEKELADSIKDCSSTKEALSKRIGVLDDDLGILSNITAMLECGDQTKLVQEDQYQLRYCTDKCTKKSYFTSKHKGLHQKLNQLQSSTSLELLRSMFADMVQGSPKELIEVSSHQQAAASSSSSTTTLTPPVFTTEPVPENPCLSGPPKKPSSDGASEACTLGPGTCELLLDRFLGIQGSLYDEKVEKEKDLEDKRSSCEKQEKDLSKEISDDQARRGAAQQLLTESTEEEQTAQQKAAHQNRRFQTDIKLLDQEVKRCHSSYMASESEICALKKIREEVYKMQADGAVKEDPKDCEVDEWSDGECSVSCGGPGTRPLTRPIVTPSSGGGVKCLPTRGERFCNYKHCPVNCEVDQWMQWSKCSAECGGGSRSRVRKVTIMMRFEGRQCPAVENTEDCNVQDCDEDCELGAWTSWSECSKWCGQGSQKRQRHISKASVGDGKCASEDSKLRTEFKECAEWSCDPFIWRADGLLHCLVPPWGLEVTLVLDGSGSMKIEGWNATKKAAELLVTAFENDLPVAPGWRGASIGVIIFGGPDKWDDYLACRDGDGGEKPSDHLEKLCRIKKLTSGSGEKNLTKVKEELSGAPFLKGATLTSSALNVVAAGTLKSGVSYNSQRIVIVFTDGKPLSKSATALSANSVKEGHRLLWVPIGRSAPLEEIKKWASPPWFENVVRAATFEALATPTLVNEVVGDICPLLRRPPRAAWWRTKA